MMPEQETKIKRTTFWMDPEFIVMGKKIAALEEGKTMTEVIEEELRKALPRRLQRALSKAHAEIGGEGGT